MRDRPCGLYRVWPGLYLITNTFKTANQGRLWPQRAASWHSDRRLVGRTNYVLKTLQFKTICPTQACTTPLEAVLVAKATEERGRRLRRQRRRRKRRRRRLQRRTERRRERRRQRRRQRTAGASTGGNAGSARTAAAAASASSTGGGATVASTAAAAASASTGGCAARARSPPDSLLWLVFKYTPAHAEQGSSIRPIL